jgi:hypothetical protein
MVIAAAIALGVVIGIPIGIALECFIRKNDTRLKSDNLKPDTYMFSYRNSHRYASTKDFKWIPSKNDD